MSAPPCYVLERLSVEDAITLIPPKDIEISHLSRFNVTDGITFRLCSVLIRCQRH